LKESTHKFLYIILWIYGNGTAAMSLFLMLWLLVITTVNNVSTGEFKAVVYSNLFNECYPEIVLLSVGLAAFIVSLVYKPYIVMFRWKKVKEL